MLDYILESYINSARLLAENNKHEYTTIYHVFFLILKNFDAQKVKNIQNVTLNLEKILLQIPRTNGKAKDSRDLEEFCNDAVKDEYIVDLYEFISEFLSHSHSEIRELFLFHDINIDDFISRFDSNQTNSDIEHKEESILEQYTINLTQKAQDGLIDNIIGRDIEIERILQILSRKKKNNPVLLGEAGVGKTSIVEAIALLISNKKAPKKLEDKQIYMLNSASIIAGTKYRGDFEERLNLLINELKNNKNSILFIDEIHTIMGTGSSTEGGLDMSNLLKPALANGEISCIGATTYADFRSLEKDKALLRRFSKVDISEPSIKDAISILNASKASYENFHKVKYPDKIIEQSVKLAKRYLTDKFLPDSAFDILDEVGASVSLNSNKKVVITQNDLLKTISKYANIDNIDQNKTNENILKSLNKNLKNQIFGQNLAIDLIVNSLFRSYAGLKDENKPIGVFLFTGSSGVGKSELAKLLAKFLNVNFERFDMSEFMEAHSVAKLIGSPPGYVGHKDGGFLINNIKKHPYSVILFDEIEKAHSDVMNIFLQIFDNAKLTGSDGEHANFENTIIIMTSNLGTKETNQVGFKKDTSYKTDIAIKGFFAPEFINRLDKIIYFKDLEKKILNQILDKYIFELEDKLKGIKLNLTKKAKDQIINLGYNTQFGARNLKRTLQESISDEISKAIIFKKLNKNQSIKIDFKDEKFNFKYL